MEKRYLYFIYLIKKLYGAVDAVSCMAVPNAYSSVTEKPMSSIIVHNYTDMTNSMLDNHHRYIGKRLIKSTPFALSYERSRISTRLYVLR